MAKAPRPGVGKRKEDQREAQKLMRITIHREIVTDKGRVVPETHELAPGLLPMRERTICRKATGGIPFGAYWSETSIDLDSILVLWWMARRANGEVTLTLTQAEEQFPMDLGGDEFDIEVDDGEDDGDDVDEESSPEG